MGFYEVGLQRSGQFTTLNEADLEAAQIHLIQKGENTMVLLGKDLDPDTIDMNSSLPGNTLGFTSEHYQSFVFFVRPMAPDRPDDGAGNRTRAIKRKVSVCFVTVSSYLSNTTTPRGGPGGEAPFRFRPARGRRMTGSAFAVLDVAWRIRI